MTLQELLGNAFKDGMTLEEINAALTDRTLLDESEVETRVTNRTAAQKRLLDAANKKLAEAQQKNTVAGTENAELLARISTLEEEAKQNKRDAAIAKDTATYVAMGYTEELARSTAEALADGNSAKVTENMSAFITQKTQSIEQAVKDQLLNGTKPPAGGGDGGSEAADKFTPPAVF